MTNNIINLVVVSHPDDEILGFGGTGSELVVRGEKVQPIIMSGLVEARNRRPDSSKLIEDIIKANSFLGFEKPVLANFPNLKMNTVPHIDLVKFIEECIIKFNPKRIFTHHPNDLNDDHKQTSRACAASVRLFQRNKDIRPLESFYYLEIPSSTDWYMPNSEFGFMPNTFFDVTNSINNKIEALSYYQDVMRSAPHPRSIQMIKGLASYRGGQGNFKYAEAFQLAFRRDF